MYVIHSCLFYPRYSLQKAALCYDCAAALPVRWLRSGASKSVCSFSADTHGHTPAAMPPQLPDTDQIRFAKF